MKNSRGESTASCCEPINSDAGERTRALLGATRDLNAEDKTRRSWLVRLSRKLVLKQLKAIERGTITVYDQGEIMHFGQPDSDGLHADIYVHSHAAYPMIATNGSIGSGEAYIHGFWTTPDLTAVTKIFVRNLDVLDAMEKGIARIGLPALKALHRFNRNTLSGSRRNIQAHYDLGNDLFENFLDPTMMYSAAVFPPQGDNLEQAQLNKLERICRKLELSADDHLLEIGTGWGSMAIYAAQHYGCRVTTTTLSKEQLAYATAKVEELGLQDRITLLLQDYRELTGEYDKLVSIEMVEAVGHEYFRTYFETCAKLLKPHGMMLLQAITIRDQRYDQARRSVDFIQRYIFPGGSLPSVSLIGELTRKHTDLSMLHLEDIGSHYARTLRFWHENLKTARGHLEQLGYDDYFFRLWEFYLCYCEGGFLERSIGTAQILLSKPDARPELDLYNLGV
ncbi:class I SAM-dependent methyltransferase [Halopseudomonas laoshanensis]|uniref:Class I SAM-dependent methyltransferase n=1 Tax=Halopseudomonas laoshanensis TaxID=2268758 RepID=A0A7V7KUE3_9GAMM|nr:cyclopropane-fatty-acyl-phospholipid synthase family protein [Halopseudomonas laoshanensis]KAA0692382.1 class I SAM-dependent methyltransferase [Halopseudomonas laoshanensis]